jgi:hypothetical protein
MKGSLTMTTTLLIAALFLAGAAYAVTSIATTLRAYWPALVALRDAENWVTREQELRVTVTTTRFDLPGEVIRPDFKRRMAHPARGLSAAA